ncbi:hypothetical protein [Actinopolymorpha pittospori]
MGPTRRTTPTTMRATRFLLASLGGTLAATMLVACQGSSPSSSESPGTGAGSDPKIGTLDVTGISRLVVDARGRTLYTNNVDTSRQIRCGSDCTSVWRPVIVTAEEVPSKIEGINGTFSAVRRPDNTVQLALNGRPLYTSTKDASRGTLRGNGIVDSYRGVSYTWHAVAALGGAASPQPTPTVSVTPDG